MADDGPIIGFKGSKGEQRTPIEAPDSLYSTAIARILDLLSEGDLEMWVSDNPLKDVFLDGTPVMNPDNTLNFQSVQVDWRPGSPDQEFIPGFPSVKSEVAIGVELKQAIPWVRAITNTQLTAISVRLATPALTKTDNSTGDTVGTRIDYAIDLATGGGAYVEVFLGAMSGKTKTKYERSHRIDLPPTNVGWTLRVRRISADSSTQYIQDKLNVQAVVDIIDAKLRYPYSAVVGIALDAQQFRSIPQRAYRVKGRVIRVPTNFNPITRAYTGVWDGTFKLAWTNNPAWIFYDLATNKRYGLGRRIDESRIDKWSLYRIGQYCDEAVPDGKGGTEARFSCTVYLQQKADAYKVMQDLASVFRGLSYWAGGAVVAIADQPEDPVYTYTNANVKDGKFQYNGTGKKARHTMAMVAWTNLDNFGKGEVVPVIDEEGIIRYGIQPTQVTAFGATSESQAQRVGRWILASELLETDACTWTVGLDGTLVAPGKIVRILDSDRAGRRLGGRISAAGANWVEVDALPNVLPVGGDKLFTITPAGTAQESVISGLDIAAKRITVSAAFPIPPAAQSVWGMQTATIAPQYMRILGITDNGDNTFSLAGLQHEPQKFAMVEQGVKIESKPISVLPANVMQAPASVTLTSLERAGEVLASTVVNADWAAVPNAAIYYIQWKRGDGEWSAPEKQTGTNVDLLNTFAGLHYARVWAVNQGGIASPARLSNGLLVVDQTTKPSSILDLEAALGVLEQTTASAEDAIALEITNRLAGDVAEQAARAAAVTAEATTRAAAVQASSDALWATVNVLEAQVGDIAGADQHVLSKAYASGELVADSGHLYRAKQAVSVGRPLNDTAYWELIGDYASLGEAVSTTVARVNVNTADITTINGLVTAVSETVTQHTARLTNTEGVATGAASASSALGVRVTTAEGAISSNTSSITALTTTVAGKATVAAVSALTTRVTDVEGVASTAAAATTGLNTRVGTVEGALVNEMITSANKNASLVATSNLLTTRMATAETNVAAAGTAVTNMESRLSNAEGTVTSHTSTLTSLSAQVNSMDTSTGGQGAAISALDTRVTNAEGVNTSQGNAITSLQNSVTSANKVFVQDTAPATAGRTEGDLWIQPTSGNRMWSLTGGAWVLRQDSGKNTVFVQDAQPTAKAVNDLWVQPSAGNKLWRWNGTTWADVADTRITANATAISSLTTRTSNAEGNITSNSASITTLTNSINSPSTGLTASATAISALDSRVGSVEGVNSAQASSISTLTSNLNGNIATVTSQAASINGLNARWGITLDVNGYVTGVSSVNNGVYSAFTVLADSFWLVAPGAAARRLFGVNAAGAYLSGDLFMGAGRIVSESATHMRVQGTGFGTTGQFVEWYGTKMAIGACSEANALSYRKVDGDQRTTGIVAGALLTAGALTIGSTRILSEAGHAAPFSFESQGMQAVTSGTQSMTVEFAEMIAPHYGGGYYFRRCASYVTDVFMEAHISGAGGTETVVFEASYDNSGAWGVINSIQIDCSGDTAMTLLLRYTTANWWHIVRFRVRTTEGHTRSLAFHMEVKNYNTSGSEPFSNSGFPSTPPAPPAPPPAPPAEPPSDFDWCVDFESMLPDGRALKSISVGDLVECIDVTTGETGMYPLLAMGVGIEDCYRLLTSGVASIIQSKSAPMNLPDGRVVTTRAMLNEHVYIKTGGKYKITIVTGLESLGARRVLKPNFGDRMFFAGESAAACIATHNIRYKP